MLSARADLPEAAAAAGLGMVDPPKGVFHQSAGLKSSSGLETQLKTVDTERLFPE
jgi:hypothetical protein